MPYIAQEEREDIDQICSDIFEHLKGEYFSAGELNYIFTKILKLNYRIPFYAKYVDYNEAIGVLECCKLELYRVAAAPYEDLKIQQNGFV
ncbi:MAG: hypothetical protein KGI54_15755 [Pseudomonadota bacterium]|nr:hypothetical protein [Pseudomonadota bacterium]